MNKVYLEYTQEELNQQYNQATLVSNIDEYIQLDLIESEEIRNNVPFVANLSYGNSLDETLDIFPSRERKSPMVVYFHGGAWKLLTKDHASFPAMTFIEQGIGFVSVNFSLVPKVTLSEQIAQCKRALQWIYENIENYSGDKANIFIAGHSSGAHLAASMLSHPWILGGLLISGIYDLEPVILSSRNEYLKLTHEEATQLSPIHHISNNAPPIVVAYSKKELPEFQRQSETFSARYGQLGNDCELIPYFHLNHFEMLHEIRNPNSPYLKAFFELMSRKYTFQKN